MSDVSLHLDLQETTPESIAPQTQSCRRLEFEQDEHMTNSCRDDEMPQPIQSKVLNQSIPTICTEVASEDEIVEPLHSNLSSEIVPRIGMEFESEDAAYEFYNGYALRVGFSIRRSASHKIKGILVDRIFVCACQGTRGIDKREVFYKSHRAETRFNCLAMLKVSCRQTGKFRVVAFNAKHNHVLASPSKAHLFRSHRKVSSSQATEVDLADISGIAPKNAFEFMARQAGGRDCLGFAQVDYKNYLRSKRSLEIKAGETGGVLEYLQSMKVADPGFFYALQVDEDDLITNIFWADAIMMDDYEDFGDIVCFDTTYRKHKDGRPIALFVGLNHHRQTIIFGVALLYDETSDSFVWLFDTFAKAMGGKLPKTMLTDQDIAMSKALKIQWPATCHRLCIWHIFQNAATHLSSVFSMYPDFARDFSKCIYDYEHEDDFLEGWSRMLDKYKLQNNEWLKRMFTIKEKWALVYGRDTFCADMITTQRSESMNKVIKHYISYKHDLRRFFEHFQRLLSDRRYDEMVADFKTSHSKVVLPVPVEILKDAANVYTPAVFKLFQAEVGKSYDCQIEPCGEMGEFMKYMVKPHVKDYSFVVSYDEVEGIVCCNCRKFEFAGILCSHILKLFSFRGITKVPSRYVLKRWRKDAKKGTNRMTAERSNFDEQPAIAKGRRYRNMCRLSTRVVTRASDFDDEYNIVMEDLTNLLGKLELKSTERPIESSLQDCHISRSDPSLDMNAEASDTTKTIRGIKMKPKSKGQSSKRPKSALETAHKRKRKPKNIEKNPIPSHVTQGNQYVQVDENGPQQTTFEGIHPWDPSAFRSYSTSLEYAQSDISINPIPTQSNQHSQFSYTTLLTSIGVPQAHLDDILEN